MQPTETPRVASEAMLSANIGSKLHIQSLSQSL